MKSKTRLSVMAILPVCLFLQKISHAELMVEAPANPERVWTQKSTGKTVKGVLRGLASSDEAAFIIAEKEIRIPLNVLVHDDLEKIREIILPTGIDTSAILRTQLTDNKNRRIEATLLSTDGRSLKFVTEKGEKIFPIHLLSEDSRTVIQKWNPKPADTPGRFVNILGMEFVLVEGTDVWFCTHETRAKDYFDYMRMGLGKSDLTLNQGWRHAVAQETEWLNVSKSFSSEDPAVKERLSSAFRNADKPESPVVSVSWDDAQAFCTWLSENSGLEYRLPSDHEWSLAVGIGNREDPNASPKDKNGLIGGQYLCRVLSDNGRADLVYQMATKKDYPGWGYMIANGATTIWERWNSYTKEGGFVAGMNSFSHYSFGAVCEWMFGSLAGIETDDPGYKHIILRPGIPSANSNPDFAPIDRVEAEYDSIRGTIKVAWSQSDNGLQYNVTIPANTTATLELPVAEGARIVEDGNPLSEVGIAVASHENGLAKITLASGTYHFAVAK